MKWIICFDVTQICSKLTGFGAKSGNRGSFPRGFNPNVYSNLKRTALENYCTQKGYDLNKVMYIGNDLNDLEVMRIIGFPVVPADAHSEIKK